MAHKKGQGSVKNGRDSVSKRLGVKKFEEFRRGTSAELLAHYEAHPAKGEITLLVSGTE